MAPGSFETQFAADHATSGGHFPGNPIIPGALLLDTVVHAIFGDRNYARPYEIRAAKFLHPVRPGDRIRIDWHHERGETHFQCTLIEAGKIALKGTLRLDDGPAR